MNNWTDRIDQTTQNFLETFGALSTEQLNWKPDPERWSIAQNIDHIIVINSSYYPVIDAVREGTYQAPFLSKLGFLVSFFGKMILNSVGPDRKRKSKTFPIWEPTASAVPEGILGRFKSHQSELKDLINRSMDLVDQGVIISSPANKNIVYKLDMAFEIIVTHEQRHFEQAKEVYRLWQEKAGR